MPMADLRQCWAGAGYGRYDRRTGTLTPSGFEEQPGRSNRQPQRANTEEKWQLPYGIQVPVHGPNARLPQSFQNDLEEFVEW